MIITALMQSMILIFLGIADMKTPSVFDRIDLEASTVAFKTNKVLANKLISFFSDLKDRSGIADLNTESFSSIAMKELGINTALTIENKPYYDARIEFPAVTKNHPLARWVGEYIQNREGVRVVKSCTQLEGYVDFKNVKVSGVLSEIRVSTKISGLTIQHFTAEELAGIICHELGHAFYNLAYLGLNTAVTGAMAAIGDDFSRLQGAGTEQIKIKLIDGFSKNAEIKIQGNRIGNASPEEAVVFVRDAYQAKWRNTHGVDGFDARECEYLADQFAVRMGLGYPLVTALDKLMKSDGRRESFPILHRVLLIVVNLFVLFTMPVLTLIIYALYTIETAYYNPEYDADQNRLERMWREMLLGLSKSDEPEHVKREIIQQIDEIRKISKQYKEEFDFWDRFIFKITKDGGRGRYIIDQQEQERMSRNTLFLAGAKLKTI